MRKRKSHLAFNFVIGHLSSAISNPLAVNHGSVLIQGPRGTSYPTVNHGSLPIWGPRETLSQPSTTTVADSPRRQKPQKHASTHPRIHQPSLPYPALP